MTFKEFLLRGNVVDMAVGIVIGLAFTAVVTAFVADWLTPLLAAIGGKQDFSNLTFTLNSSRFLYGHFINALISFLLIALVLYFGVIYPMNRFFPAPVTTMACSECLEKIPLLARRCKYCCQAVAQSRADEAVSAKEMKEIREAAEVTKTEGSRKPSVEHV